MFRSAPVRAARGVTLVELMVALVVAAILLAVAVPSFRHLMGSSNLGGVTNDLAGDIAFARMESVTRRVDIAVASSSAGWAAGWTVQIPSAATTGLPPPPEILRTHPPIPNTYTVTVAGAATKVEYQPDGSLNSPPPGGICFTFKAPTDTNNKSSYLWVQSSGSVSQASAATSPAGWACP